MLLQDFKGQLIKILLYCVVPGNLIAAEVVKQTSRNSTGKIIKRSSSEPDRGGWWCNCGHHWHRNEKRHYPCDCLCDDSARLKKNPVFHHPILIWGSVNVFLKLSIISAGWIIGRSDFFLFILRVATRPFQYNTSFHISTAFLCEQKIPDFRAPLTTRAGVLKINILSFTISKNPNNSAAPFPWFQEDRPAGWNHRKGSCDRWKLQMTRSYPFRQTVPGLPLQ